MPTNLQAIILAAGKSKRCKTGRTKLIEKICGREMVLYPIHLLNKLNVHVTAVVGYQKEIIQPVITQHTSKPIHFVTQNEQHGTGHAILCARDSWQDEHILIMHGSTPLVTQEIIENLYKKHLKTSADISFVTAHNTTPVVDAYARVIKNGDHVDLKHPHEINDSLQEHCWIDAGIYIVTKQFLTENIQDIEKNEIHKEFILCDLVKLANKKNYKITTTKAPFDYVRHINNLQELWEAEHIMRAQIIRYWMNEGVRFSTPQNIHIDVDVNIGAGTIIGCGSQIFGSTKIGVNCTIDPFSVLKNATIHDNVAIKSFTVIKNSEIFDNATIGPFAHVQNNSTINKESMIGNFVEVTRSTIGQQTKAKHLSYLGDAFVGNKVNIGAGTITCNYDGSKKHPTTIQDKAFIGSNNSIVAPVTIGTGALTAAGSTITDDVPNEALAIARARQTNKNNYASQISAKKDINKTNNNIKKTKKEHEVSFIGAFKTNNDTYRVD